MLKIRTVGCFMDCDGKFLILHRQPEKSQGSKWGLPAGKVDPGESDEDAIIREINEETGYVANKEELETLGVFVYNFPDKQVTFPSFKIKLKKQFEVKLSDYEHQAFKWVTAKECYDMPNLVHGLHELLVQTGYIKENPK
jgi:8-oxo-dGTP diphosphatase